MAKSYYVDGALVYKYLAKLGWSYFDLSRKSGISRSTIFALTSKRRKASEKTLIRLSEALNVFPHMLVEKDKEGQDESD